MANFVYKKAKQAILNAQINFLTDVLKVVLVDDTYISNQDADQYISDIPSLAIKKRSVALTNVTTNLGVLDAFDLAIPDHDGSAFSSVILYKDTGSDSTSILIFYIDTSPGLPFTGTLGSTPVTITWNNDSSKIMSL